MLCEGQSAEAVSNGVNRSVPRYYRAEPKTLRGVHTAKVVKGSRERTRCGCTQVVWVADVGWTHRASSAPGGRKACWSTRALAGKKPKALFDAGHGWTEGETVRELTAPIRSWWIRSAGFGSLILYTTEGTLGLPAIMLLPAGWYGVLGTVGQTPRQFLVGNRKERVTGSASGG